MKLIFKQERLSDICDICDEYGRLIYTTYNIFGLGYKTDILDDDDNYVISLRQKVFTLGYKFMIYDREKLIGTISKKSFFNPIYEMDCKKWYIRGNMLEWDFEILDQNDNTKAYISKVLFTSGTVYELDFDEEEDAIYIMLFLLALNYEKKSKNFNLPFDFLN